MIAEIALAILWLAAALAVLQLGLGFAQHLQGVAQAGFVAVEGAWVLWSGHGARQGCGERASTLAADTARCSHQDIRMLIF